MDHLKFSTPDMVSGNIEKIATLFPSAITEMRGEDGEIKKGINFEVLKQLLSRDVVDGDECYEFTWVGKKAAMVEAARPITKTLRPVKEDSRDWDTTENLYIEGDNLEVLKILQESYLGKVKMIYIDPPYNTGSDRFIYPDDYSMTKAEYDEFSKNIDEDGYKLCEENLDTNPMFHSVWCSMISSRLMLARNLLTNDGTIFISIDDSEIENLRKICNEIFGADNLINCFIWNCSTAGGIRPKFASKTHEYILCYAKCKEYVSSFFAPLSSDAIKMYTQKDEKGIYRDKDFVFKNKSTNINQKYYIECPDGEKVIPKQGYIYRFIRERFDEALQNGLVTFKKTETGPLLNERGEQAHWNIYIKKYLGDALGAPSTLIPKEMMSIYNVGTQCVQSLFDNTRVFENVKPVDVITYLANMTAGKDSIILDFFSGSATTAHAVMQLNAEDGGHRKFIMVQLPEPCNEKSEAYKAGYKNICEIGKERIRRAGDKILEQCGVRSVERGVEGQTAMDNSTLQTPNSKLDVGFRVFRVDSSNMKDVYYHPDELEQQSLLELVSNIKDDRTDLDLLYACLLDWGVEIHLPHTSTDLDGCTIHDVDNGALMACFSANVPVSVVEHMAKQQPLRAVFRDSAFPSDDAKINVTEIFKNLSPDTKVKVI